jgi:hypothetical protein
MRKNDRPRMSLVRRARTKLRRGDYSGELAPEVLEKLASGLLRDLRRRS